MQTIKVALIQMKNIVFDHKIKMMRTFQMSFKFTIYLNITIKTIYLILFLKI